MALEENPIIRKLISAKKDELVPVTQEEFNWLCNNDWRQLAEAKATVIEKKGEDNAPNWAEIAVELIYGDREQTHGEPDKNFQCIATFWSAYIKGKSTLTVDDVCNMMNLLKIARSKNNPEHEDNDIDSIGYILLKERIREHRKGVANS